LVEVVAVTASEVRARMLKTVVMRGNGFGGLFGIDGEEVL
jgi:hypothetical protein